MQDYIEIRIDCTDCSETVTDLLAAFLGDIGFESFSPDADGLTAYIQDHLYDKTKLDEVIADFPMETDMKVTEKFVKGKDWNEEWEKHYFQPIAIGDEVVVHSSFHKDIPAARYDILIDPKMAFGTGHHSTTSQMIQLILESDMKGKRVIDMGTGTGILAILCKMRGAEAVVGIEIDSFAWENSIENVALNHVAAEMICGDAQALEGLPDADFFLANINRNIITGDLGYYSNKIKAGGELLLSGFYEQDIPVVMKVASQYGFELRERKVDKDWAAIRLVKSVNI